MSSQPVCGLLYRLLVDDHAIVCESRFFSPGDSAGSGFGSPTPGIAIGRATVQTAHVQVTPSPPAHTWRPRRCRCAPWG
jgi:hypothetical protein